MEPSRCEAPVAPVEWRGGPLSLSAPPVAVVFTLLCVPLDWKSFEGRADISCPEKYLRPRPLIFVFGGLKKAGDIFLIGKVKQEVIEV